MSVNVADIDRIPNSLRGLGWVPAATHSVFYNGQELLIAVPVCSMNGGPWRYELFVVVIDCDEDHFDLKLDGELCEWEWEDVHYFVWIRQ
jgi:hypothetical protein